MNTVDVLVPCYNYGAYLEACVESILRQHGVDVRVLVIDDGSTDDSAKVAGRLAASDARVTVRHHQPNCGHIATYNEGIAWARAEYFVLFQADDVLADGALARATAALHAHPDVGFVYGPQQSFSTAAPPAISPPERHGCRIMAGREFIEECLMAVYNQISLPSVVVRTDLQKEVGGYLRELPHTGDLEMWLRLASCGRGVAELDSVQVFRRRHPRAMHLDYARSQRVDLEHHLAAYEAVFRQQRGRLTNADEFAHRARMAVGDAAFWRASSAFEAGDRDGCASLLAFAVDLAPSLRHTRQWRRLAWKRRVGPAVWRSIAPLVNGVRSMGPAVGRSGSVQ